MPKLKTKSCVKKRCKLASGQVKVGHVNKRHLLMNHPHKRNRQARRMHTAGKTVARILKFFIHGKGV